MILAYLQYPWKKTLATCRFPDADVVIKLWTEQKLEGPDKLFYRVKHDGQTVVSKAYLTRHNATTWLPVLEFTTSEDELIALNFDLPGSPNWMVIYDTVSCKSWPMVHSPGIRKPVLDQDWTNRYRRLKTENPRMKNYTGPVFSRQYSEQDAGGASNPETTRTGTPQQ